MIGIVILFRSNDHLDAIYVYRIKMDVCQNGILHT
jgi:hypothetical protein